jgi:hypothetical protein
LVNLKNGNSCCLEVLSRIGGKVVAVSKEAPTESSDARAMSQTNCVKMRVQPNGFWLREVHVGWLGIVHDQSVAQKVIGGGKCCLEVEAHVGVAG